MNPTATTLVIAAILYMAYREQTGGKSAVTGQPLPTWEEMVADLDKKPVVEAWCASAEAASKLPLHIVAGQPDPLTVDAHPEDEGADLELKRLERINENKALRQRLDLAVEHLRTSPHAGPERTLAMREIQSARHWLGEDLAKHGAPYPYARGNDARTNAVDPAADKAKA